jgi:hypothetical protein
MYEHRHEDKPAAETRDTRLQFGIASLLLTTTLVAVLLALFRWVPGLGLLLIVLVTPAFAQVTVVASREKRLGRHLTILQKVLALVASAGLVIATALASGLAFYIAGFVVSLIAVWQPRRAFASIGSGLGLAACGVTVVYFNATKYELRSRTPDSLTSLGFAMALGFVLAIAVPLIVWWRIRQQPALKVTNGLLEN